MGGNGAVILILVALFLLITALLGARDKRNAKRRFLQRIRNEYGKAPSVKYDEHAAVRIPKYFLAHRAEHALDDITWNDLELDRVFRRINYCHSAAGEEYLYALLRTPSLSDDFADAERRRDLLQEDRALREKLQELFAEIGRTGKYSIYDYLHSLRDIKKQGNGKEFVALGVIALSVVLLFVNFSVGILLLIAMFAFQMITFYRRKGEIEPYLVCFDYILRLLRDGAQIRKEIAQKMPTEAEEISTYLQKFQSFKTGSSLVRAGMYNGAGASGNLIDILMDYVNIFLHLNLIKFNQMLAEAIKHEEEIDALISCVGRLESDLSVVCYRASLQNDAGEAAYCLPEFIDEDVYSGEQMVHPLLSEPVAESITATRGVLITGSNASGKSTFLKTCALQSVLAQTIHTCTALQYRAPMYCIYSSMALRDDMQGGDSYYIVEIKSLKRILDAMEEGSRVLCFIDEVLRGTNTVERIAASTQILKHFAGTAVQVFAATHDVELTELLKDDYDNYHFEGIVTDGDVRFDYKLHEGPGNTRNAIALLQLMGYEEAIVQRAEAMAEHFLKEGHWSE